MKIITKQQKNNNNTKNTTQRTSKKNSKIIKYASKIGLPHTFKINKNTQIKNNFIEMPLLAY